jgi:hypothetical protein
MSHEPRSLSKQNYITDLYKSPSSLTQASNITNDTGSNNQGF